MLKELSRQERIAKIEAIANREECKFYSLYFDYYQGTHFIKTDITNTNYGRNSVYRIATRSGIELFDTFTQEDKVVVKSNWCRPIIETIGDYTRGINEEIVVTAKEKEEEIQKIWQDNRIDTLTHEIAYQAGIFGKTYLRLRKVNDQWKIIKVNPDEIYENKNPFTGEVESVLWFFEIDNEQARKMFPEVKIKEGLFQKGFVYYCEEWTQKKVNKYLDGQEINEKNEEGLVKELNPYGFIPFVEVKGNIYNQSDIHDVISLNDELNITLTYINEIFKYSAFPMLAPKGTFDANQPALSKAQLNEVEVSPRTILPIPMERVSGEGVDQSVFKHIEQLEKDIAIVSGVPIKLLMAEINGNISGIALQRMMSSVMKQAEVRRNYIRDAYKKINQLILGVESEINFPEITRVDMNERLDEMLKKQTLGISKKTIFSELGYNYEEEQAQVQEEFDNLLEKRIIDEQSALQSNRSPIEEKGNSAK